MEDVRIILSALWVALMLTYLLGDVLRIFAGDFVAGEIDGQQASEWMWMTAAVMMLIPIVMSVLSLTVGFPAIRWVTIGAAIVLAIFNLAGLPYDSLFDNFLIAVGLVLNVVIVGYVWTWQVAS